jgi:hypothetical protein
LENLFSTKPATPSFERNKLIEAPARDEEMEVRSQPIPEAARIKLEEAQSHFFHDRKLGTVVKVRDQIKVWDCIVMAKSFLGEAPQEAPAAASPDLARADGYYHGYAHGRQSAADLVRAMRDSLETAHNWIGGRMEDHRLSDLYKSAASFLADVESKTETRPAPSGESPGAARPRVPCRSCKGTGTNDGSACVKCGSSGKRPAHVYDEIDDEAPGGAATAREGGGMLSYFVSYQYKIGKGWGFGSCQVRREEPILNSQDLESIAEDIPSVMSVQPDGNPIIMYWRRFEAPEAPGADNGEGASRG